jgi:hypothetical protein
MRAVVQRVTSASVKVDQHIVGDIGIGSGADRRSRVSGSRLLLDQEPRCSVLNILVV